MTKKQRSSMKTEAGVGDPCPRCARPMRRWKHAPAWTPAAGRCWYEMWDECLHKDCRTTLVMPRQFMRGGAPRASVALPAPAVTLDPQQRIAQLEAENALLRKRLSDAQRIIHRREALMREDGDRRAHWESI